MGLYSLVALVASPRLVGGVGAAQGQNCGSSVAVSCALACRPAAARESRACAEEPPGGRSPSPRPRLHLARSEAVAEGAQGGQNRA